MALKYDSSDPTGVVETRGKTTQQVETARVRKARAAVDLRVKGYDWDDIAISLGFPTGRHALVACEKALSEELDIQSKGALRSILSRRMEQGMRKTQEKAMSDEREDQAVWMAKWLDQMKFYAELHGLKAPAELVVSSPQAMELQAFVDKLSAASMPELQEADIFGDDVVDAEVMED